MLQMVLCKWHWNWGFGTAQINLVYSQVKGIERENLAKLYVGAPLEGGAPSWGKSWIRHWRDIHLTQHRSGKVVSGPRSSGYSGQVGEGLRNLKSIMSVTYMSRCIPKCEVSLADLFVPALVPKSARLGNHASALYDMWFMGAGPVKSFGSNWMSRLPLYAPSQIGKLSFGTWLSIEPCQL